jgi:hypothetical protein
MERGTTIGEPGRGVTGTAEDGALFAVLNAEDLPRDVTALCIVMRLQSQDH